eukprot:g18529.t1
MLLLTLLVATALLTPAAVATTDEPVDAGLECADDFAGDGQCDDVNNSAACGYDKGDCCQCTCVPTADYNCGGNYNCIDPQATCVDDDDGDGGVMTSQTIVSDDFSAAEDILQADVDATATDDTDSATGRRRNSLISAAGFAAAAGSAVLLAGWGL